MVRVSRVIVRMVGLLWSVWVSVRASVRVRFRLIVLVGECQIWLLLQYLY